jgi:hypothetical protein
MDNIKDFPAIEASENINTYFHNAMSSLKRQYEEVARKRRDRCVQGTIGAPQFAIVFTKEPDAATVARIEKLGMKAYSLSRFAGMIELQQAVA